MALVCDVDGKFLDVDVDRVDVDGRFLDVDVDRVDVDCRLAPSVKEAQILFSCNKAVFLQ